MVELEDIKEIVSATIDEYYQLDNKCSIIKSSPYYAQALEMSEKYGLRLKKCTRNQLRFEDTGHTNPLNDRIKSTEIRFDGMLDNPHIDRPSCPSAFRPGAPGRSAHPPSHGRLPFPAGWRRGSPRYPDERP